MEKLELIKADYPELYSLLQSIDYSIELMRDVKTSMHPVEQHEIKNFSVLDHIISSKNMVNKVYEGWDLYNKMEYTERRKAEVDRYKKRSEATREGLKKAKEAKKKEVTKVF